MLLSPRVANPARPPLRKRFQRWLHGLTRRARPDNDGLIRVSGRQIYILPSGFGVLYGTMLVGMLLGANNYGSNPGFLFTFLLAGLGMAALFQTWRNLLGLEIRAAGCSPVFCGNDAVFNLRVFNPSPSPRGGIVLRGRGQNKRKSRRVSPDRVSTDRVDIAAGQHSLLVVSKPAQQRGWLDLQGVVVESVFPLGLFRAWAYIEPDMQCLVYPQPAERGSGHDLHFATPRQVPADTLEGDDFAGHRPYLTGDNIHHVDWKAVARGQGWHTKQFASEGGEQIWLRLHCADGSGIEQRLSGLTRAVLEADASDFSYGLDLGSRRIEPASGQAHRDRCLKAMALVNTTNESTGDGPPGDGR